MTIYSYWKPRFKWELVDWFVKQGILTKAKANKMQKKQLYGKYIETRKGDFR